MARSGINIRVKKNNRFISQDVVYDLKDIEFKDWVNCKLDYSFGPHKLSIAERYKVIEDMQEYGIPIFVDKDVLSSEDWWNKIDTPSTQPEA